jgi:purine nucleosidase
VRAFLIDTDTASDDAVALLMALRWPDVDVVGVTIVSGNLPLERCARNALYTLELCGSSAPVYLGAAAPLVRANYHAEWFHGEDGMGNMHYPAPQRRPETEPAADAIVEIVRCHPGLTLVTLGPLTNVALAIRRRPQLVNDVERVVVMGGAACTVGNITPAAEYNIWIDPEAASIVFRSGLPIEMVGWELSRGDANLVGRDLERIRAYDNDLSRFALDCNRVVLNSTRTQSRDPGLGLPDPVAMAVALDPAVCTLKSRHYVEIETASALTRGMTVVDRLGRAGDEINAPAWGHLTIRPPNVSVCWQLDTGLWKEMLFRVLGDCSPGPRPALG